MTTFQQHSVKGQDKLNMPRSQRSTQQKKLENKVPKPVVPKTPSKSHFAGLQLACRGQSTSLGFCLSYRGLNTASSTYQPCGVRLVNTLSLVFHS